MWGWENLGIYKAIYAGSGTDFGGGLRRECWQSKIKANHNRGNILVSYFELTIAPLATVGIVTYCHHYIFMMCVIFIPS